MGLIKQEKIGATNFISQILFIWIFSFISQIRSCKNVKKFNFILRQRDTSIYNDEILENEWKREKFNAEKDKRFINKHFI